MVHNFYREPVDTGLGTVTYWLIAADPTKEKAIMIKERVCSAWLSLGKAAELDAHMHRLLKFKAKTLHGIDLDA